MKKVKHIYVGMRWILLFLVIAIFCWVKAIYLIGRYLNSDSIIGLITVMSILFLIFGILFGFAIAKSEPMPDESPQAEKEVAENQKCQ